jgi:hypothetical protein
VEIFTKAWNSLSSLAIAHSLPAAHIDLWGLMVLAFANGPNRAQEAGSRDQTMLTPFEWNHLLWVSHTFKEHDRI